MLQAYSIAEAELGKGIRNDVVAIYTSARLPNWEGEEAAAHDTVSLFQENLTAGKFLADILSSLPAEKEDAEVSSAG